MLIQRLVCLVVLCLYASPAVANTNDSITWYTNDAPPVRILDGPYAKQGVADHVLKIMREGLTDYEHKELVMNRSRFLAMLKAEEKVADVGLLKLPEREEYIEFSIPVGLIIPNAVIVKENRLSELEPFIDDGYFMFEKALKESNLKVGISSQRAYGGIVDKVCQKNATSENIHTYAGGKMFKPLLELVMNNRIDYTIGYPFEAQYLALKYDWQEKLVSLPILGMPRYLPVHVGAPKNAWGKQVIKRVNEIIREHRKAGDFRAGFELWLDDSSKERYRKFIQEIY